MQSYIDELMPLEYVGVTNISNYVLIHHLLEIPLCIIFANYIFQHFNLDSWRILIDLSICIFSVVLTNIVHHLDHLPGF